MKAFYISAVGGKTVLEKRDVPQPQPNAGQVLVKVKAVGLNRGEFIVGGLVKAGAAKPAGNEAAGGGVEGGERSGLRAGQRVVGRCPGAVAQDALVDEREAIPGPADLSWGETAASPPALMGRAEMLIQQGK